MAADDPELVFVARMDDQASKAADLLEKNLADVGGPIDAITGDVRLDDSKAVAALDHLDGELDGFVKEADDAGEQAGDKMGGSFGEGLKGALAGGAIVGAGALGGKLLADAFQGALDAESDGARLTASLGLNPEDAARFGDAAGSLYAQAYGDSLGEVSGSVGAVVSSIDGMRDATSQAVEDATADAMNFADVFEVDVARGAQIAGQLIREGLAGDAEEAFDLMTAAAQKVPANIREDLLDAADEYGPFFAALGYSGEEAFAALVAGSEKGMYGIDKTGDALKEFGIRATDMSKSTNGVYESLGFNSLEMADKLLAGGDTAKTAMGQIVDGILAIESPAQQASAAIALFGTPLEDLGVDEIPAFLEGLKGGEDGLGDFSQATEDVAEVMGGTAQQALEAQTRELQKMGTDALATLMPYLVDFLAWVKETPGVLPALATALGLMAVAWAAVTLAASPWLAIGFGIAAGIALIVLVIKNWGPIMDWIGEKIAAVGAWIGETFDKVRQWIAEKVGQVIGWVKANWPLLLAIITGPLGLIVLYVVRHFDEIKNGISERVSAVIGFFRELPGRILSAVGNLAGTLLGAGRDVVEGLWNGIKGAASWLASKVTGFVKDAIPGPIRKALGIASPSKVVAAITRWVGPGAAQGLYAGMGEAVDAAEQFAENVAAPMNNIGADMSGNILPAVSVAGSTSSAQVVTIRHEVTSPDGSVNQYTAAQIADMISRDATAARITSDTVRAQTRQRDARTLVATN